MNFDPKGIKEKNNIAFTSVMAAIFLTSMKLVVGISTGSLGILSEALHSGLDFIAALITYFAVRIADKPADVEHNYGHGKVENYSALIETILLVVTCFWIIYEALHRLITGRLHIEITFWSYAVIIISIIIDFSRSRALSRVAKKYNSQALEADALHFSTDIWSSVVVIAGLLLASLKLQYADSVAALIVAFIVLYVSYKLGKRSFDALIDTAPSGLTEKISQIVLDIPEVLKFHNIRIRESGAYKFVELNIHVDKKLNIDKAHEISHKVENALHNQIENINVTVHIEPDVEQEIN